MTKAGRLSSSDVLHGRKKCPVCGHAMTEDERNPGRFNCSNLVCAGWELADGDADEVSPYDGQCLYCRHPILYLVDPYSQEILEVEQKASREGYVRVDLTTGHCFVVPAKLAAKQEGLHLPHIVECTGDTTNLWPMQSKPDRFEEERLRGLHQRRVRPRR